MEGIKMKPNRPIISDPSLIVRVKKVKHQTISGGKFITPLLEMI